MAGRHWKEYAEEKMARKTGVKKIVIVRGE